MSLHKNNLFRNCKTNNFFKFLVYMDYKAPGLQHKHTEGNIKLKSTQVPTWELSQKNLYRELGGKTFVLVALSF
jgi:hypothetical protein